MMQHRPKRIRRLTLLQGLCCDGWFTIAEYEFHAMALAKVHEYTRSRPTVAFRAITERDYRREVAKRH